MRTGLIVFLFAALFTAFPLKAKEISKGNYKLIIGSDGSLTLSYNSMELLAVKPAQCSDSKWQPLFKPEMPEISENETADTYTAVLTSSKAGTVNECTEKLTLSSDGFSLETNLGAARNIDHFSKEIILPWGEYASCPYFLKMGKDGKGQKRGILPGNEVPEKVISQHDGMQAMHELLIKRKDDCVKFEFNSGNWSFGDYRTAGWVKNFQIYSLQKADSGKTTSNFVKVSVLPQDKFPERKADLADMSKNTVENDFLQIELFWKTLAIRNFIDKTADAALVRRIFESSHKHDGFLWGSWSGDFRQYFFERGTAPDGRLTLSKSDKDIAMTQMLALFNNESILHFEIAVDNKSGKKVEDCYFYQVGVNPGRIENEYNTNAFAFYPGSNGFYEKALITDLWGVYKYKAKLPAFALVDATESSAFVQVIRNGSGKYFNLTVGAQGMHGSRDAGKRVSTGITFSEFSLEPNNSSTIAYDWVVLKGLKGFCGYSNGLGMDAGTLSPVYHTGDKIEMFTDFSAASPQGREIRAEVRITDGKKIVETMREIIKVSLATGKNMRRIIDWKIPEGHQKLNIEIYLYDNRNSSLLGKTRSIVKTSGARPCDYLESIAKLKREISDIENGMPYLGAEYPETLTAKVKAEFFIGKIGKALQPCINLDAAEQAFKAAEKALAEMRSASGKELKTPFSPVFRKLSDRDAKGYFYSIGNKIYTPSGNRAFLWGAIDEAAAGEHMYNFEYDPAGEFKAAAKLPYKEKLKNEKLKGMLIERLVKEIKQFGNASSLYIKLSFEDKEESELHMKYVMQLLERLEKEGIWTTVLIHSPRPEKSKASNWLIYVDKECVAEWEKSYTILAQKISTMKNITHYVVPSPEPLLPKATSKETRRLWTEYVIKKYGSLGNAAAAWGKNYVTSKEMDEKLLEAPRYTADEAAYSPAIKDYSDFLSEILITTNRQLIKGIRSSDKNHIIFGGGSTWTCWPVETTAYLDNVAISKDISGFVFDHYVGGWWGGVNNPPELWWDPAIYFGQKPCFYGEWGAGVAMDKSSWTYGIEAHDQAWGRSFAGLKLNGMFAWSYGPTPWCNIFDPKTGEPKAAARRIIGMRNELIANPLTRKPEVLLINNTKGMTKYLYVTAVRLFSYFPRIQVDADMGDFESLETWDLSPYKLIVCQTEGMGTKEIEILKRVKNKVLLLGRPASAPGKSAVDDWIKSGLFIRAAVPWTGRGTSFEKNIMMTEDFGSFGKAKEFKHSFAENKSCLITSDSLMDDVQILAKTGENPVLMRQENITWWTDMLGIETLDMPPTKAPPYPQIRKSEENILKTALNDAGVKYTDEPLLVWIVNDVAFSYETETGRVDIHNQGTVTLPKGMLLRSYERFEDGISIEPGGVAEEDGAVIVRYNADKVRTVTRDGKDVAFKVLDKRHIKINFEKGSEKCELLIKF